MNDDATSNAEEMASEPGSDDNGEPVVPLRHLIELDPGFVLPEFIARHVKSHKTTTCQYLEAGA